MPLVFALAAPGEREDDEVLVFALAPFHPFEPLLIGRMVRRKRRIDRTISAAPECERHRYRDRQSRK